MKGRHMSQCPPEYLDMVAERCDFFASKEDADGTKDAKGNPKSKWTKLEAAKARGWARRLRAGYKPAAVADDGLGDPWPDTTSDPF